MLYLPEIMLKRTETSEYQVFLEKSFITKKIYIYHCIEYEDYPKFIIQKQTKLCMVFKFNMWRSYSLRFWIHHLQMLDWLLLRALSCTLIWVHLQNLLDFVRSKLFAQFEFIWLVFIAAIFFLHQHSISVHLKSSLKNNCHHFLYKFHAYCNTFDGRN